MSVTTEIQSGVSREGVFVHRVIRAVKLRQMTVSDFQLIDTSTFQTGDVNTTEQCLILAEKVRFGGTGYWIFTNFPVHA